MILSLLILICCIFPYTSTIFADESDLGTTDVGIIILTQPNEYHDELFQKKKKEILHQANSLKQLQVLIYQSYELQDDGGHWIILPLLEKMTFSLPAVKLVAAYCKCGSIDSPDDMVIGMCLKAMGIPVTHSSYFHQARPFDYAPYFLKPFKHISFHKHWMIDPYSVYKEWLQDSPDSVLHTEL